MNEHEQEVGGEVVETIRALIGADVLESAGEDADGEPLFRIGPRFSAALWLLQGLAAQAAGQPDQAPAGFPAPQPWSEGLGRN